MRVLGARSPFLAGPMAVAEDGETIWYAPQKGVLPTRLDRTADVVAAGDDDTNVSMDVPAETLTLFQEGIRHVQRDEFEQATVCFQQAIDLTPDFVDAHWNLGLALQFMGRIDASITAMHRALDLQPDLPAAHMNLSMSLFLKGEFAEACREYEWRWKCPRFGQRSVKRLAPNWQGESLAGKTVLVYGEQGIGDEIMFASGFQNLIDAAERCVITCQVRLVPLFRRSFPTAVVVANEILDDSESHGELGRIDYQVAAGSTLQYRRPSTTESPQRFLVASDDGRKRWEDRLAGLGPGKRVGISWRGGHEPAETRRRSTSPKQWAPVFDVDGIQLVNLQYGVRDSELDEAKATSGREIHHWPDMDPLSDMDDLAALVASLDLVISIDNSTVHFAGALGVPAWVLISFPSSSYWRWFLEGDGSMWYTSLRLFRKQGAQDWGSLFESVARELALAF